MPELPGRRGVHRRRRAGLPATELHDAEDAGARHVSGRRLRQVRVRRRRADQRDRRARRRDRPPAAVEGAAQGRRVPQLQAAAADPDGRGAVPLPLPARDREVPARPGERSAPADAQLARVGVGAPVQAARARPGAARHHGGHRQGRDRPGHRRLLRGRRARAHRRAPRPTITRLRRAGRPPTSNSPTARCCPPTSRLRHRLHPGRAVPDRPTWPSASSTSAATSCSTARSSRWASTA